MIWDLGSGCGDGGGSTDDTLIQYRCQPIAFGSRRICLHIVADLAASPGNRFILTCLRMHEIPDKVCELPLRMYNEGRLQRTIPTALY
jgi:hypothetical protein